MSEVQYYWIVAHKRAKQKLWTPKTKHDFYDSVYWSEDDARSTFLSKDGYEVYRVKMTLEKPHA